MTVIEAATSLGIAPGTIRSQIAKGHLRARKIGRNWTISSREVERYQRDSLGRRTPGARRHKESAGSGPPAPSRVKTPMPGVRLELGRVDVEGYDSALEWRTGDWVVTGSAGWLLGRGTPVAVPHVAVIPTITHPHMVTADDGQIYLYAVFAVGLGSYTAMRLLDASGNAVSREDLIRTIEALGHELSNETNAQR